MHVGGLKVEIEIGVFLKIELKIKERPSFKTTKRQLCPFKKRQNDINTALESVLLCVHK